MKTSNKLILYFIGALFVYFFAGYTELIIKGEKKTKASLYAQIFRHQTKDKHLKVIRIEGNKSPIEIYTKNSDNEFISQIHYEHKNEFLARKYFSQTVQGDTITLKFTSNSPLDIAKFVIPKGYGIREIIAIDSQIKLHASLSKELKITLKNAKATAGINDLYWTSLSIDAVSSSIDFEQSDISTLRYNLADATLNLKASDIKSEKGTLDNTSKLFW
ncbi:hypothetical protein FUAX_36000 [Fulvitalea axinellae]|uniref:Auto-transporter adhesin head GIN domain-containing protein n=1 Tax=Fulvitalea axinellae TaxID=1182444 RepID=A0AAU9D594_9BACT|nr:hypothetical protein FUAX_36000 [Fulvitalea axinellae]